MGLSKTQREALDARVRAVDFTVPGACDKGSMQRRQVAGLLAGTSLIADECDRVVPSDRSGLVRDYVEPRIMEKILGVSLVSNPNSWNPGGLWDPLYGGSFCGWARQLSSRMAHACARRVLHGHTHPIGDWDREDGSNPIMEKADATPVPIADMSGLTVPRPVAAARRDLTEWAGRERDAERMMRRLRRAGWWHASLDRVEPTRAVALLLGPMPRTVAASTLFLDSVDDALHGAAVVWWRDQTGCRVDARLRQVVEETARVLDCSQWRVYCRLGTAGASLLH